MESIFVFIGSISLNDPTIAVVLFIAIFAGLLMMRHILLRHCKLLVARTKFRFDDLLFCYLGKVHLLFCAAVALFFSLQHLTLPETADRVLHAFILVVLTVQAVVILEGIAQDLAERFLDRDGIPGIPRVLAWLVRAVLWSIGAILILANLGINVTSLLAGLGIGGIAISLALQNVIGDLFSSFSIAVDKPFREGDYIVVGSHKGTVKYIGMKTTRIEALQGEEIVISNTELMNARVQNFKMMRHRRVEFTFMLPFDTPSEKLKTVGTVAREIIEAQPLAEFDRAHVRTFAEWGLHCEVVFFVNDSDYNRSVDVQEAVVLGLLRRFAELGIVMALPPRTVCMR